MSNPNGLQGVGDPSSEAGAGAGGRRGHSTEYGVNDPIGDRMWDRHPTQTLDNDDASHGGRDTDRDITRMYFQNIRGLRYGQLGGDTIEVANAIQEGQIDIMGICETHLDSTRHKVKRACKAGFRSHFQHFRVQMASSLRQYTTEFKPGGVMLVSQGPVVGRIRVDLSGDDDMGRWCYTTYIGANGKLLTVIMSYQVTNGQPTNDLRSDQSRIKSEAAVVQQYSMMIERGLPLTRHPRDQFRRDLLSLLQRLQQSGCEVILAGDFNEPLGSEPTGMSYIMQEAGLVDIMAQRMGTTEFNTWEYGRQRIDYILTTPQVATACIAAGYEPFRSRFQSADHRGMFVEFNTQRLFGNESPCMGSPASRSIHSRNSKQRTQYVKAKHEYLVGHRWFERLGRLVQSENPDFQVAEGLDRDWVRASIHAEKQCKRFPHCPFSWKIAQARKRLKGLIVTIQEMKQGTGYEAARNIALQHFPGLLPNTLEECETERNTLRKNIRSWEKDAVTYRRTEQQALVAERLEAGDRVGAKAVRNIMIAEETKEMFRTMRVLEDAQDSGITRLEIPANGDFTSCKSCKEWVSIDTPQAIQDALMKRNRIHFGQAHGTFPTVPPFSERIDWGASTYAAELILEGRVTDGAFEETELQELETLLLENFKRTTRIDSIEAEITEQDWIGKMKVWKESTTTSPSGMHLGHHKALLQPFTTATMSPTSNDEENEALENMRCALLKGQLDLINFAIRHEYSYQRWQQVVNVMLLKEPGNTKVHRLRVIHLYEADWNLVLGVKWRQLVHHIVDNRLINEWQFGGLPGREALTPLFAEEMQWEISRSSRRSLLRMDFDATSCYDRIIPSIASLAARSFGQHRSLVLLHARTLAEAKYRLKFSLNLSDEWYQHCEVYPIYGTGQGSANSPVIWGCVSSRAFDAYESKAHGATFVSPDRKHRLQVYIAGFVDDTNASTNDFEAPVQDAMKILQMAQSDAQLWNDLLYGTGGALEVSKCQFHIAHFEFTIAGAPVMTTFDPAKAKIEVEESGDTQELANVKYLPATTPRKSLGCYKSPAGTCSIQIAAIRKKAVRKSSLVAHSHLDSKGAHRYYHAVFWPSVSYPLPVSFLPEKQLLEVQRPTTRQFLRKMGYAKNTPSAVIYGPVEYGGLDLHQWYDAQGAGQLELIMKHWRNPSGIKEHSRLALMWAQWQSGLGTPILQEPTIPLPHLDSKYFAEFRNFLSKIGGSVEIDEDLAAPLQREGDFHLMERMVRSNQFTPNDIRRLSYCLHYLQVQTVADITTATGKYLDLGMLAGTPTVLSSRARHLPIVQGKPSSKLSWRLWTKANRLWADASGRLHQPLGRWLKSSKDLRRTWPFHFDNHRRCLLIQTPSGYTTHRQSRSIRHFCSIPSEVVQELPTSARPVDCKEHLLHIELLAYIPILLPVIQPHPRTFNQYVSNLEEWEQTLLQHISWERPVPEAVDLLVQGFLAVSDGSDKNSQGTFGWVLASEQEGGIILAKGKGPAFGTPMDSYRAESYGQLSLLLFIHHVLLFHGKGLRGSGKVVTDSQSFLKRIAAIRQSARPQFPNDTLIPSWDVLQAVVTLLQQQPNISLAHVKGHQDDNTPVQDLPLDARLNVEADRLAGEFQSESAHKRLSVPMIRGTRLQFQVQGQTIAARHRRHAQRIRKTAALRTAIQTRLGLSDAVFDNIDWESHRVATNNWSGPRKFIVKFLHNLLPVGKRIHRYDPVRYEQHCPSCAEPVEDLDHFLRCQHTTRAKWMDDLRLAVREKCGKLGSDETLIEILMDGLYHWHRSTEFPRDNYDPTFHPLLDGQEAIGWDQILFGRFSVQWQAYQLAYLNRNNIPKTHQNHGSTWLSIIIRTVWDKCHAQWEVRNVDKHGQDLEAQQRVKKAHLRRRIEHLYSLRDRCAPSVRTKWFYRDVDEHFQRTPNVDKLEAWLTTFSPMITRQVRDRQTVMEQFLQVPHARLSLEQDREGIG